MRYASTCAALVTIVLVTPELVLRHLVPQDLDVLFALYRYPEIRRHFPDGTRTLEQTRQELEWFQHGRPGFPSLGSWATVRVAQKAGMAFERERIDEHGLCHIYSRPLSPTQ